MTITCTELQNNVGKYLALAQQGARIRITKNGKLIAQLENREKQRSLVDELHGLSDDITPPDEWDYHQSRRQAAQARQLGGTA